MNKVYVYMKRIKLFQVERKEKHGGATRQNGLSGFSQSMVGSGSRVGSSSSRLGSGTLIGSASRLNSTSGLGSVSRMSSSSRINSASRMNSASRSRNRLMSRQEMKPDVIRDIPGFGFQLQDEDGDKTPVAQVNTANSCNQELRKQSTPDQ